MASLFLAPHPDDESLFGAYTILREKPLVAIIRNTEERMNESKEAMKILGAEVTFIDDISELGDFETVYAPAKEGGHPLHDSLSDQAREKWKNVIYYSTYRSGSDLQPKGNIKVEATEEMKALKLKALDCYTSQIKATPCHFELKNKDEYYV